MIGESPAHSKTCTLRNRLLSLQSPPSELRAPTVWTLQQAVNRLISVNQTGWHYVLFGIDFQIPKGFVTNWLSVSYILAVFTCWVED